MNQKEVEERIRALLKERKSRVIGKNVVSAALSLFTNPGRSLEKLFFGVNADIANEKLRFEQELMLELICKVNDSFDEIKEKFNSKFEGQPSIIIDGEINVESKNSEETVGMHIKQNSGMVEFKPGTKIKVKTANSDKTTGLKIGE